MEHHINQCAPQKSVVTTNDIDEQAHNLTQWQQVYDQVSNGSFYGCIEGLDYPEAHLFKEFTQRALRQQCNIAPESIWLGIPRFSDQSKINGLPVDTHQFMCRSSDCDFELMTPEQIRDIVCQQPLYWEEKIKSNAEELMQHTFDFMTYLQMISDNGAVLDLAFLNRK